MSEKLLILDDEVDMLTLLETIIRAKTPHEVVVTNNPLEIEDLMAAQPFSLVISDLKMLGRDGLEVIDVVHRADATIPVVIITAYGSLESAQEVVRHGAYDYITKPFRKEQVLITIERALEWRRITRENLRLRERS
ncbi:MAG: response regulator [Thermoanaerobaculaceae bacterium]|nr:response regulator [Thermoanaerobaculaceae bacterium]TAM46927.1 MAG: response regulator [Acidobacteriota bacterium]